MATFISYSRDNSDFALRLARDIREAGFDIWLDQLDIRTGTRWDDEVEKALEKSTTFLIILTPEAIQSQNVKDEIGYAIDASKHILPIILQPCNVPFRLRRFQYVDFSNKPYDESLAEIKHLLTNISQLARAKDDGKDHVQPKRPVSTLESEKVKPPRQWNMQIAIGAISTVVTVCAVALGVIFWKDRMTPEPTLTKPATAIITLTFQPIIQSQTPEPSETPVEVFTPTPTDDSLSIEITDAKGAEMVLVPAGKFTMGTDDRRTEPDEQPSHEVYLNAFYIDKYEVTNALYKDCVGAQVCATPKDVASETRDNYFGNLDFETYPVLYVDWFMAKTYCEWRGARLPTEAEWEKAARGTDQRTYPWGENIGTTFANYNKGDTTAVGSYENGKSIYDVYDMAGNVWEWVADWYAPDYYEASPSENPLGPETGNNRAERGGSWNTATEQPLISFNRSRNNPDYSSSDLGFRCAKDANQ